jgi:hypothetical protein
LGEGAVCKEIDRRRIEEERKKREVRKMKKYTI